MNLNLFLLVVLYGISNGMIHKNVTRIGAKNNVSSTSIDGQQLIKKPLVNVLASNNQTIVFKNCGDHLHSRHVEVDLSLFAHDMDKLADHILEKVSGSDAKTLQN